VELIANRSESLSMTRRLPNAQPSADAAQSRPPMSSGGTDRRRCDVTTMAERTPTLDLLTDKGVLVHTAFAGGS